MRKLLMILGLLSTINLSSYAATITLEWDASVSPDVAGYAIFDRNFQKPYAYDAPLWEGPGLTCTVTAPDDRQSAYVARAFAWGPYDLQGNRTKIWSGDSNEVTFTPAVKKPDPPRNLVIRILQAIGRFFKGLVG